MKTDWYCEGLTGLGVRFLLRRRAKWYPFEGPPDFLATTRRLRATTRRPRSRDLPKTERAEKDLNGARHKAPSKYNLKIIKE